MIVKSIAWPCEEATRAFAQALAAQPGLAQAFIELRGDLGAGKTTFVRHLLGALGVVGRIKSPTYAVVEPYELANGLNIWHFDFYRFNDPDEWEEAGFRDIFASPGLKLAEWAGNAGKHLPSPDLVIAIEAADANEETNQTSQTSQGADARRVTLTALTDAGARLLP
jgi:tRNA threonylcarbamoyladenosine biosynthesis protein TsaE